MRQLAALLLIGVALVGCTSSPARQSTDYGSLSERALSELSKRTDADSLAAAALLGRIRHRDESLAFVRRALAARPGRPDLVWLELVSCQEAPGCDPRPIELELRVLDPTNGAGWLGSLARADSSDDGEARDEALSAIARSSRVDIYWTTLVAELSRAVSNTKAMSLGDAEVTVIGFLAAEAIPAYRDVSDACKGDNLQLAETVVLCRGIARAFEQGDTYTTEMIGTAIAMRVWPKESPAWQSAYMSRRRCEYRMKELAALDTDYLDARVAKNHLALYSKYRREQDVSRDRLTQAGLSPDPPSN